jgi:glycosyltransferase involved in cell wall biosynthesis
MTKNKTVKYHPFVSIICVTFNRRPFFPAFFQCIRNQDYPASRYEVIIVDDGTDKIKDLVELSNIPQIKYFSVDKKMTLGDKRNYSHTLIDKRSKFISYFDDDDYHCHCRISHAVEMLEKYPKALCGGTSELYIYFKHVRRMIVFGPYNPNHATAGTFTFRRELLDITKYDDTACFGEERLFLKDYTIPFVQFDSLKTILVISHLHNTCDKKDLITEPLSPFTRESNVTVDMFMSKKNEASIKNFFMNTIDQMLLEYDLGLGKHKPETMLKLEEFKKERAKDSNNNNNVSFISIKREGEEPIQLSQEQVVQLLRDQQNEINQLKQEEVITIKKDDGQPSQISIQQASQILQDQQNEIINLRKYIDELKSSFVNDSTTHKEHLITKEIHL